MIKKLLGDPNRVQAMKEAADTKGGWEGWLQVEISLGLKNLSLNSDVCREEEIYEGHGNHNRIDIWFKPEGHPHIGIEIKCRNKNTPSHRDENNGLPALMMKDINKINGDIKTYPDSPILYAIAITREVDDLMLRSRMGFDATEWTPWIWKRYEGMKPIKWCYLYDNQEGPIEKTFWQDSKENLYLIWYKK